MNPAEVVRAVLAALADADGERIAALASGASLHRYAAGVRDECDAAEQPAALTTEAYSDADVPEAVRAYWVESSARFAADRRPALLRAYPGTQSLAELRELPPGQMLARSLRALHSSLRTGRVIDGVIWEGDARAYVLFRLDWKREAGAHDDPPDICCLVLEDGAWRIVLDPLAAFGLPGYQGFSYSPQVEAHASGEVNGRTHGGSPA